MTFDIQWVDQVSGSEETFYLRYPAGILALYSQSGVICRADWNVDKDFEPPLHSFFLRQSGTDWFNTDSLISIKLLKQGTNFRNKVWSELCKIPFGETITYSALAKKVGSAPRAIGNACRDNPFPLLIPCHRVVSVSGLGGYNGATEGDFMAIKRKLLAFEAAHKK